MTDGIRRNIWFTPEVNEKLIELRDHYGSNYSAVIQMLIVDKHATVFNPAPQGEQLEDE